MANPVSIILIGPMGAGKTTIGRALAKLRGLQFVDADHEIEARCGVDIPYIFQREGEEGFRKRERETLVELLSQRAMVLATGGGAILNSDTRRDLRQSGLVVYLHATVDQQLSRTKGSKNRPLLNTPNPRERLESLFAVRDPLYRETAHLIMPTQGRFVRRLAGKINQQIDEFLLQNPLG